jgi:predicted ATPase
MAIERKQALDRAHELAKQVGDEAYQLEAVEGLHGYYANRGEWYIVYNIAQEMVLLAEKLEDPRHLCKAYHGLANTYMHRGEFLASLQYQRRVIAIDAELGPPELNGVSPRSRMAEALWYCGYPEQAQRLAAEAIRLTDARQNPFDRVHVQCLVMFLAQHCGDVAAVQRLASENAELCVRYGFPSYARDAQLFKGWVMVQNGAVQQGLQQMVEVLTLQQQHQDGFYQPYFLALLAEAQGKNGNMLGALATIEQALQLVADLGDQSWQAELLRCAGELRYQIDPWDAHVEELYGEALDVARRQHAKSLELRAAMSLAALWQQHGARQQARDLLSGVYEWFTEGFDTPDLQRARTLLTDLGSA